MDVWDMLWLGLIVRELMGSRLDKDAMPCSSSNSSVVREMRSRRLKVRSMSFCSSASVIARLTPSCWFCVTSRDARSDSHSSSVVSA